MHREYVAARVLRAYLRWVLQKIPSAVIAGSYPAAMYAESFGAISWRPCDIDIFVFSHADVEVVVDRYQRLIREELSAECESSQCGNYSGLHDDQQPVRSARGNAASLPSNVLASLARRRELERAISDSVVGHNESLYSPAWGDVARGQLLRSLVAQTVENLPRDSRRPGYVVKHAVRVSMLGAFGNTPRAALPINVIHVDVRDSDHVPLDAARLICESFDITLCCVALKEIQEDLSFGKFESYCGAFEDLRLNSLRLTERAFFSQASSVENQMRRIYKYLSRGFRWRSTLGSSVDASVCVVPSSCN